MIKLTDVSVKYKDNGVDALKHVNLQIDKGEFVFVVGPSGAGKSTLIKLLLREIKPDDGEVNVNGFSLGRLSRRHVAKYRRSIGVVFQDFRLIPSMTVYDNVAFALRVIDASAKKIRARVPYILGLVNLTQKAKSYPSQISGGEQQRVALARALVNNPSILIADEPTGNIDPELSIEMMELLQAVNKLGTTVVVVTHEHDLVRQFGGRVVTIQSGKIVFDDVIGGSHEGE